MDATTESQNNNHFTSHPSDVPRLAGFLIGDIDQDTAVAAKYGLLFRSLARLYGPISVFDVSLRRFSHLWNGIRTFHPILRTWKERSYKNPYAFINHSRIAASYIKDQQASIDIAIQVGVLFNAGMDTAHIPLLIYTDYTTLVSSDSPYQFSSLWKGVHLTKWIEYECQAYHRAAHIFTRSKLIGENLINEYGVPAERVSQVGGGINFYPLPEPPLRAPRENAILLFIGSNFLRKGGDVLLKAFAIARKRFPKARLKVLTRDTVLPIYPMDGVEIIPYVWDRERIAQLYMETDFFVLPSRQETWGDVILEAAAYGLPSIGTYGQAMEEIIKEGETGLLVQIGNIEQLANAMIKLLGDPGLRLYMGNKARERAVSFYTWDQVAGRMASIIDSVYKNFRS